MFGSKREKGLNGKYFTDLSYLGVTITKVECHDLLMDILLSKHGLRISATVQSSMDETGVVGIKPKIAQ